MILVGGLLGMCPEKANRKLDKPGRYNDTKKDSVPELWPHAKPAAKYPSTIYPTPRVLPTADARRRGKARGKHGRRDRYTARPALVGQGAGAVVKG